MESIPFVLISLGCIPVFIGFLLLIATNYSSVLYLNVLLISAAFFEPAPSDIVFIFLIAFMWRKERFSLLNIYKAAFMTIPLFFYILINIIALFNIQDFKGAIAYMAITFYLIFYALFILGSSSMTKHIRIFHAYVLSSTLAAALGIAGYVFRIPLLTVYEFTRAKALFKDPNVFGPFLVPAIIILLSSLRRKNLKKPEKWMYLSAILVNFTGLVLSFSRGAYVNFLAALLAYVMLNIRRIPLKRFIAYLMIAVLISGILWVGVLNEDFKSFLAGRLKLQTYDSDRFEAQRTGLAYAGERLFGHGPGQYGLMVEKTIGQGYAAHSLYIRILLENGISGFIIIMVFFVLLMKSIFKGCTGSQGQERENCIILFSVLCGILINSFVVDTLHWRHFWLFAGLGMSMITGIYMNSDNQQKGGV